MATTMVHIRVDEKVKKRAAKTLAAIGHVGVRRGTLVAGSRAPREALPFHVKVPNRITIKAMRAAIRERGSALNPPLSFFVSLGGRGVVKPIQEVGSDADGLSLLDSRLSTSRLEFDGTKRECL